MAIATSEIISLFPLFFRQNLRAQHTVVDLHEKCFYFYEIGLKLSPIFNEDIIETLLVCLDERYQ